MDNLRIYFCFTIALFLSVGCNQNNQKTNGHKPSLESLSSEHVKALNEENKSSSTPIIVEEVPWEDELIKDKTEKLKHPCPSEDELHTNNIKHQKNEFLVEVKISCDSLMRYNFGNDIVMDKLISIDIAKNGEDFLSKKLNTESFRRLLKLKEDDFLLFFIEFQEMIPDGFLFNATYGHWSNQVIGGDFNFQFQLILENDGKFILKGK